MLSQTGCRTDVGRM